MQKLGLQYKTVVIIGAAGFAGYGLLMDMMRNIRPCNAIGLDNLGGSNHEMKEQLIEDLYDYLDDHKGTGAHFVTKDMRDAKLMSDLFRSYMPEMVINLAMGDTSIVKDADSEEFEASNIYGFYNMLEVCRHSYDRGKAGVQHMLFVAGTNLYDPEDVEEEWETDIEKEDALYEKLTSGEDVKGLLAELCRTQDKPCAYLARIYARKNNTPTTAIKFTREFAGSYDDKKLVKELADLLKDALQSAPDRLTDQSDASETPYQVYTVG